MQFPHQDADERRGLYIKTFGCQMNVYDSQKLCELLKDGYRLVADPAQADLLIVNTCSVREKPQHKRAADDRPSSSPDPRPSQPLGAG